PLANARAPTWSASSAAASSVCTRTDDRSRPSERSNVARCALGSACPLPSCSVSVRLPGFPDVAVVAPPVPPRLPCIWSRVVLIVRSTEGAREARHHLDISPTIWRAPPAGPAHRHPHRDPSPVLQTLHTAQARGLSTTEQPDSPAVLKVWPHEPVAAPEHMAAGAIASVLAITPNITAAGCPSPQPHPVRCGVRRSPCGGWIGAASGGVVGRRGVIERITKAPGAVLPDR